MEQCADLYHFKSWRLSTKCFNFHALLKLIDARIQIRCNLNYFHFISVLLEENLYSDLKILGSCWVYAGLCSHLHMFCICDCICICIGICICDCICDCIGNCICIWSSGCVCIAMSRLYLSIHVGECLLQVLNAKEAKHW